MPWLWRPPVRHSSMFREYKHIFKESKYIGFYGFRYAFKSSKYVEDVYIPREQQRLTTMRSLVQGRTNPCLTLLKC